MIMLALKQLQLLQQINQTNWWTIHDLELGEMHEWIDLFHNREREREFEMIKPREASVKYNIATIIPDNSTAYEIQNQKKT